MSSSEIQRAHELVDPLGSPSAHALMEALPALVWTTDASGTTTFANARWREFSGCDIVGDGAYHLIHPDDREAIHVAWRRVRDGGAAFEMEYRIRRIDGTYRWHAVRAHAVHDATRAVVAWCGAALDIDARRRDEDSFRVLADAVPQLIWVLRADGAFDFCNERLTTYAGLSAAGSPRALVRRLVHPDDRRGALAAWRAAVAGRREFEMRVRLRRDDAVYRWFLVRAVPAFGDDAVLERFVGSATDIDDQQRSSLALAFFDRISDLLGQANDPVAVLQTVAELAVPALADWCSISLFDDADGGRPRPIAIAHRDAAQVAAAWNLLREYPPTADRPGLRRATLGVSSFQDSEVAFLDASIDGRHGDALRAFDLRSAVVAPIVARGRPLGALYFVSGGDRLLGEDERRIAEIVGKRLGVAIENAHIYERERLISTSFQQAALSHVLPSVPGLDLHAVYVAAEREAEIGGDWYDAFTLDDGRVVISIGDVAGKGLEAAVLMGSLRQAIRVVALKGFDPADILEATSSLVAREAGDRFATAFVGIIDPATWSLRYATAAHPLPIFRRPDGSTMFLHADPSPPLGLITAPPTSAMLVSIPAHSMLVLYTDGLIEATRDIFVGERRLLATVESLAVLHSGDPARLIRDTVLHDGVHDDVAVLTVVFGRSKRWSFDARDAMSAHGARSSFLAALRAEGAPGGDYIGSEVIFGELIGNVVRHAPGPIDVTLDWAEREPVLHVIDRGPGFVREPKLPDPLSESGRGLFIIDSLARSFEAAPIPGRGTHMIVRLPVERE